MRDQRVLRLSGAQVRADIFTAKVYARLAPDARRRVREMATRSVSLAPPSITLKDCDGATPPMPGMDVAEVTFMLNGDALSCVLTLERTTRRGWRPVLNDRDVVWVGTLPEAVASAAVGRDAADVTGLALLAGKTVTHVEVATGFVRVEYDSTEIELMDPPHTGEA